MKEKIAKNEAEVCHYQQVLSSEADKKFIENRCRLAIKEFKEGKCVPAEVIFKEMEDILKDVEIRRRRGKL